MALFIRPIGVVRRDRAVGGLHLAGPRLHRLHAPHTLPRPRHNPSRPRILTQPRCSIFPPLPGSFAWPHHTFPDSSPYRHMFVAVLTACALWWVAACVSPDNPWDYERKKPPETIKINVHGENLRIKYCGTSLHRHHPFTAQFSDVRLRVGLLVGYARLVPCRHVPHLPTTASHSLLRVQQLRRTLRPPLYPSPPPLRVLFSSLFFSSLRVICPHAWSVDSLTSLHVPGSATASDVGTTRHFSPSCGAPSSVRAPLFPPGRVSHIVSS